MHNARIYNDNACAYLKDTSEGFFVNFEQFLSIDKESLGFIYIYFIKIAKV